LTLGAVRQILRPWLGRPAAALPFFPNPAEPEPNRISVMMPEWVSNF
jgi:hypothetical protein